MFINGLILGKSHALGPVRRGFAVYPSRANVDRPRNLIDDDALYGCGSQAAALGNIWRFPANPLEQAPNVMASVGDAVRGRSLGLFRRRHAMAAWFSISKATA